MEKAIKEKYVVDEDAAMSKNHQKPPFFISPQ